MEEQKTKLIPTKENFSLNKIKLTKNGGVEFDYEVVDVVGVSAYVRKIHESSASDVHPDLRNLFKKLKPIMGRIFGFTAFLTLVESREFKATKNQMAMSEELADKCKERIEPRSISLSGEEDDLCVVLTGQLYVTDNMQTAVNSPRLHLNTETFGFEEELEDIVGSIEDEAYAFLFENKRSQGELFNPDGTATEQAKAIDFDEDEGEEEGDEGEDLDI